MNLHDTSYLACTYVESMRVKSEVHTQIASDNEGRIVTNEKQI